MVGQAVTRWTEDIHPFEKQRSKDPDSSSASNSETETLLSITQRNYLNYWIKQDLKMIILNMYFLLINQQEGAHEEDQILRDQIKKLDFLSSFIYSMMC